MQSTCHIVDIRKSHGEELLSSLNAAGSVVADEHEARISWQCLQAFKEALIDELSLLESSGLVFLWRSDVE